MTGVELLVALAIAVGLVGILVPILPGSVLVLGAHPGLGLARRRRHRLGGLRASPR